MATRLRQVLLLMITPVLGLALLLGPHAAWGQEWRLTVKDAKPRGGQTPIVVEVPATMPPGSYIGKPAGRVLAIVAQVFEDSGKTWLASVLPAGAVDGTFRLHRPRSRSGEAPSGVVLDPHGSRISFTLDQRLADGVPHRRRRQAIPVPADRPDRGLVHPGLPDGVRGR